MCFGWSYTIRVSRIKPTNVNTLIINNTVNPIATVIINAIII